MYRLVPTKSILVQHKLKMLFLHQIFNELICVGIKYRISVGRNQPIFYKYKLPVCVMCNL
jgi:hypothetical protein